MLDFPSKLDKLLFREYSEGINLMRLAATLTPPLLANLMMDSILTTFQVIVDAGHDVPDTHRAIINKQNAVELSENKKDMEWAESVVPMLTGEDVDWSLTRCMWCCYNRHFNENEIRLWCESVFTNSLWNSIDAIGKAPQRSRLTSALALFLEQTAHFGKEILFLSDVLLTRHVLAFVDFCFEWNEPRHILKP